MFEVVDQKWNFTTKRLFPFICSKILAALAIEVNRSHLKLYSIACGSYHGLLNIVLLLTRKLLDHGFLVLKLKSSLRMLYGHRQDDHINHYGVSVSQMTTDMFHLWFAIRFFSHSCLITGFVIRETRRVALVEQELFTLPKHQIRPRL